jgi:formylglycine-generating enzyme required for sulfatase activity
MRWFPFALVSVSGFLIITSAMAEEPARLALLIGNSGYAQKVGPLKNPRNDVAIVGAALNKLGFKVTIVNDADYRAMDTAIKRYVADVRSAGRGAISFFYYSGHGVANPDTQINYLVPVDVSDPSDGNLWYQSFQQNEVIDRLSKQAPSATHYVVFDACRNELNLSGGAAKALGAEKGFVPVQQTAGLLIAYATAPNKTASDVGEGGGPYAKALAEELVKPGVEAVTMFRNVQIRVKESIGQDPWLSFPSLPSIYLAGRLSDTAKPPPAPAAGPSEAERAWADAKNATNPAVLESFIKRFGDSFYGDLARAQLEDLKKRQVAVVAPPVAVPSGPCGGVLSVSLSRSALPLSASEECALKPKDVFKECDTCPEMIVIAAGSFTMGSSNSEPERGGDEAQVPVTIDAPIAVGKFAVTFDEWDTCVSDGGCGGYKPEDEGWGHDNRPVINVSWDDAQKYVKWLNGKTGKTYRLLSESEREYVTRAGTKTPFWWGSAITPEQANYAGTVAPYKGGGEKGEYRQKTVPVDSFAPNPWGLYNVHGNVWDWTQDCWNDSNNGNPGDGSARTIGDCSRRVLRGGSWLSGPGFLRAASRDGNAADFRGSRSGFRLVRTLTP